MSREALRKLRLASRILIGFGVLVTVPLGMELFGMQIPPASRYGPFCGELGSWAAMYAPSCGALQPGEGKEREKMKLIEDLEKYVPSCEQEVRDKAVMLQFLRTHEDAFLRSNLIAHVTASGWVVSDSGRVLMAYHKIYDSWAWTGGHADGDEDLLAVAIREAQEESGLGQVTPRQETPFSIEVLTVNGHEKRGAYVPSHLHLNVTYLLRGDESEPLRIKEDENAGVAWFDPEEAIRKCTEPWMAANIYRKLADKMKTVL